MGASSLLACLCTILTVTATHVQTATGRMLCEGLGNTEDNSTTQRLNIYECPGSSDPPELLECCGDGASCCAPSAPPVALPPELLMMISISVIATCLVFSLIVVVCCFCSRCPLYNTCRVRYTQEDIIAYGKTDETLTMMPPEEKEGQNHYSPVKIRMKEDV